MNKQTFALLSFLVLIAGVLVYLAVSQPSEEARPEPTTEKAAKPTPSLIQTVLSLSPSTVEVSSAAGSVDVNINSASNSVTGVQLELSYDPTVLSDVTVSPASFFETPSVLINKIDAKNGKISYAIVIPPTGAAKKGAGNVATIKFNVLRGAKTSSTQIQFLPKSIVTAEGLGYSVLKSTSDATVIISQGKSSPLPLQQGTTTP